MPDDKININLPTLSTLDVGVEQREPSHTETSLSNEAGARDENENSSVGSNENAAEHVAINVHHDDDSSHKRRSTEAEAPVDLEAVPALDPPLPLQMIQSQAEDTFLREKRFKIRGGMELLCDEECPPLPLSMTWEEDMNIQKQKLTHLRNLTTQTNDNNESDSVATEFQQHPRPNNSTRERPIFFAVEATPVTEERRATVLNSGSGRECEPSSISYAEPFPNNYSKVNRKIVAWSLFAIAAVLISITVAAVIFIKPPCCHPPPKPFSSELDCEVVPQGVYFETDCGPCTHSIGMDKDTIIITRDREEGQIHVLSNQNGSLSSDSRLPRMYVEEIEVSEHVVALSDPWAGENRSYIGVVYVYEKIGDEWANLVNITPTNISDGAEFGKAISVDEASMAVTAPADSSGSVFVYRREDGEWKQESKVKGGANSVEFGTDVVIKDERTLIVSDKWANNTGMVIIYHFNSTSSQWEYAQTLTEDSCDDRFGYSIALTNDQRGTLGLVVGCIFTQNDTGAVYYYTAITDGNQDFALRQIITKFNGDTLPELGGKVFVNDNFLAIGSEIAGLAFILTNLDNKWREVAAIDAPLSSDAPKFGRDVGLSGNNIFISSWHNVHLFQLQTSCLTKRRKIMHHGRA